MTPSVHPRRHGVRLPSDAGDARVAGPGLGRHGSPADRPTRRGGAAGHPAGLPANAGGDRDGRRICPRAGPLEGHGRAARQRAQRRPLHRRRRHRQNPGRPGAGRLAADPRRSSRRRCAKVGSNSYVAGYLPYSIVDGWQQLAKDFAYWRILTAAIPREHNPGRKAWLQRDLARREALTLADLGVWAHFVGDASQPMHVSVHFNGWGPYPNPNGYTEEKVHASVRGRLRARQYQRRQVRAAMTPSDPCAEAIEVCTSRYLAATEATVDTFYALEKDGAFRGVDTGQGPGLRRRAAGGGGRRAARPGDHRLGGEREGQ